MIMAGGTGGHIFPALAVAGAPARAGLGRRVARQRARGMEARLVPPRGYTMAWIRFSGVRGKGLLRVRAAAAEPAHRVLAERARDLRAPARRRARDGRLRLVSRAA